MEVTIILPCAGEGKRLGLSIPKELYEIWPGFKLIDFSLNHILQTLSKNLGWKIKIAVVIRPGKEEVFHYVKNRLESCHSKANVISAQFDKNYYEWAGSVYSANQTFSEYNLALLPDTLICLSYSNIYNIDSGLTLLELMVNALRFNPLIFAWTECHDPKRLSNLGALSIRDNLILKLQDKPSTNLDHYNAFWGAYSFRKTAAKITYDFLSASIRHQDSNVWEEKLFPTKGVEFAEYCDLGTWDSINKFRERFQPADFEFILQTG